MRFRIETSYLYIFIVFACASSFFLSNAAAQTQEGPALGAVADNYTYDTIDVEGVDFLALTASSDFGDYAGYTKSMDGEKDVAFYPHRWCFYDLRFPGCPKHVFLCTG